MEKNLSGKRKYNIYGNMEELLGKNYKVEKLIKKISLFEDIQKY